VTRGYPDFRIQKIVEDLLGELRDYMKIYSAFYDGLRRYFPFHTANTLLVDLDDLTVIAQTAQIYKGLYWIVNNGYVVLDLWSKLDPKPQKYLGFICRTRTDTGDGYPHYYGLAIDENNWYACKFDVIISGGDFYLRKCVDGTKTDLTEVKEAVDLPKLSPQDVMFLRDYSGVILAGRADKVRIAHYDTDVLDVKHLYLEAGTPADHNSYIIFKKVLIFWE